MRTGGGREHWHRNQAEANGIGPPFIGDPLIKYIERNPRARIEPAGETEIALGRNQRDLR